MFCAPPLSAGSADRVVPVSPPTTHPASARTDVPASQPRSRAGLRSTIETSSDLETREKSKLDPGRKEILQALIFHASMDNILDHYSNSPLQYD